MRKGRTWNIEWLWRFGRLAVLGMALFVLVFNFGVLVVVFMTSLSKTKFLVFPPRGHTLSWYGHLGRYKQAIIYSLKVAFLAATFAATLGTLAAFTLVRSTIRFKSAIMAFLLSPLIIPSTIFALAALVGLTQIGWHPGLVPLVIALTIHASPYCVRVVASGFQGADWELEAAARSLGASRRRAFSRVILPLVAPSVAMGFVITFILAFDDSSISIFLASPTHETYGAALLADISDHLTPVIAAAGSAVIGVTLLGVMLLGVLYWLQRRLLGETRVNPLEAAGTPAAAAPEDLIAA